MADSNGINDMNNVNTNAIGYQYDEDNVPVNVANSEEGDS